MITILEAINLSTKYLSEKGIESPRVNAELLLAEIIGCKRLDLYLSFERPLAETELQKYRDFIKRRGKFEPLQYIIGKVEFYGLGLNVNPSVLIPRPETELLVENILTQYSKEQKVTILDIGCGSGNISIALAANLPFAEVFSTDVSSDALNVAKANADKHKLNNRMSFAVHNILEDDLDGFPLFDLVVSNPPYVSENDFSTLQLEIKEYEPRIAVTDYKDGYTFFRLISEKCFTKLKNDGMLFFEVAQGQSEEVKMILAKNNFSNITTIKDYQNIVRIIFGVKK